MRELDFAAGATMKETGARQMWTSAAVAIASLVLASCGSSSPNNVSGRDGGSVQSAGTGGPASQGGSTGASGTGDPASQGGSTGASGTGGAEAGAGAAGASGSAGSPAQGGGGGSSDDGGAAMPSSDAGGLTSADFVCTELIGLWVASQWWGSFEKGVDGAHWQFMFQHHGYLEMFADPASPYWNNAVSSKCAMGSATPDRVVFLPFSLSLKTMDEWVTNLTKVVETMKGKFPGVKRIELMTTLRSPGNMPCPNDNDPNTVVPAYVDMAIQTVADASGGLAVVGPKIELGNCSWWAGGTDLTGAGNTGAGQLLAAYYQTH